MKKNYEIQITRTATIVITGAESEQEAMDFAEMYVSPDDFGEYETEVQHELTKSQVADAKRDGTPVHEAEL